MSVPYRFAPWTRRGLARAHANADSANAALQTRPRISVGLTLQAKRDGTSVTAVSGNVDLTLYGPADIIGIDQQLVVRTEPRANATDFEPNYLAAVDFDPPDFPWLLTPARANAGEQLRPWLVLVVVERSQVAPPSLRPGRPLPSIVLTAQQVLTELPDLRESALWAHAQAVSTVTVPSDPAAQGSVKQQLSLEFQNAPERSISRLICPRRLKARTAYIACVVPATDGGRLRGIGQPVNLATLGPAWSHQAPNDIELPVYFSWTFSTGPVGDIETLARRLRTPSQYPADPEFLKKLRAIGQRDIYVDGDRLLVEGTQPGQTVFEGAMVALGFKPAEANQVYANKLAEILNSESQTLASGANPATHVPTLAPPIYGEYPAKRHVLYPQRVSSHWLDGLSLQPRYRLVAGWGAEIVRQNQEEFMRAAWEQLGDIIAAERAFSLARLSRDVLKRIEVRHLAKLSPDRVLAVMAPARARIAVATGQSLYGKIEQATLPHELFDGAMRRLVNPRRPALKMARWRERKRNLASVTAQMRVLVDDFANAAQRLAKIDPNFFVPDGIVDAKSFDRIPLPNNLEAMVDLMPYTGLAGSMSGAEIKAIQEANATARNLAQSLKRTPPPIGDIRRGLLTETHARRLAQLQSVAGAPLSGNVAAVIREHSKSGTEGVLLSVSQGGTVVGQALRIDARSGAIKPVGSPLRAAARGRPERLTRAAGVPMKSLATVPPDALKLYGSKAVFSTLPPATLGRKDQIQIEVSRPGNFGKVPPATTETAPTITVPPAAKDQETLQRYATAFKEYQLVVVPPANAYAQIQPVNFATTTAVAQLRARIDANRTVPARLASTLSLGAQSVTWADGVLKNEFISATLDNALVERLRYIIPRTFDRVMAFPKLPFPLSRKLETLAPDVFLPGVGVLPNDFIMAVQTNPRFVEAVMVGANHEMGREMLWRGLPTDQRGTPFQHFWQRLDGKTDVDFIHRWNAAVPLGSQPGNAPMTVLLFRGRLLERFPDLLIYAYPTDGTEKRPGEKTSEMDPAKAMMPVLRGRLLHDITYVGFPIDPAVMDKYFFLIEEHMTEPRFGFDERVGQGQSSNSWQDVDWNDLRVEPGAYFGLQALQRAEPATGPNWNNPHAARVADALLQRPFRGYWRGSALKTPGA